MTSSPLLNVLPCSRLCRIFVSGPLSSASCKLRWGACRRRKRLKRSTCFVNADEASWRAVSGVEVETHQANALCSFVAATTLKLDLALDAAVIGFYVSQMICGLRLLWRQPRC